MLRVILSEMKLVMRRDRAAGKKQSLRQTSCALLLRACKESATCLNML